MDRPDRVGILRKLRHGASLKKEQGKYVLDLTERRGQHKTARFYGPSKTTINELIAPWITKYLELIEFDRVDENPLFYLFPVSNDFSRAVSASQWGSQIKAMFKRWSGIEVTPKSLRSSYICWLKGATDAPEILQAAAKAMRHTDDTQASDRYDVEGNDRLVAASTSFTLAYASKFQPSGAPQASSSGSPRERPVIDEWVLIPNQPVGFTFRVAPKEPEAVDYRVFEHKLKWLDDGMAPGCQVKFAMAQWHAHVRLILSLLDSIQCCSRASFISSFSPFMAARASLALTLASFWSISGVVTLFGFGSIIYFLFYQNIINCC